MLSGWLDLEEKKILFVRLHFSYNGHLPNCVTLNYTEQKKSNMELKVLNSNSQGNCYLLVGRDEVLIIEAGIKFSEVKKALNYNIGNIVGCLITHEHNDHAGCYLEYLEYGFPVLSPEAVYKNKGNAAILPFAKVVQPGKGYKVGNFKVTPFEVQHDVPALGYQIDHPDMGRLIFLTDTFYCEYTFDNVTTWLIEANYADDILDRNIADGRMPPSMRSRLLKSHMELETTKGILRVNDLTNTQNIVLIHLSDGNSDETRFVREIAGLTGKPTIAAKKGVELWIGKLPY